MSLANTAVVWPGITEEQSDHPALQLGFGGYWAEWMGLALAPGPVEDAVREHGLEPLLAHQAQGQEESEVTWTTPAELAAAARKLADLFRDGHEDVRPMLTLLDEAWGGSDLTAEEYVEHLEELARGAEHAAGQGAEAVATRVEF